MKILILGASGMAGHVISLYLNEKGYDVTGFTRRPISYCKNIVGDALNPNDIKKSIENEQFDYIVNAIGILNQFAEKDKATAVYLNSYLPHFIADLIKNTKCRIIQISTDCVFSGENAPYYEDSFPNGNSFYDRTKALGELVDERNITFRNSIIGPDIKKEGIGLFNWFMKQKDHLHGYTHAIWTGVTTITLAKAIEATMRTQLTGIYHLVNNESINKYDLLCLFNHYFRNDTLNIIMDDKLQINKSLRNTRNDFDFNVPSYNDQIEEMKDWCDNHKELYPHYYEQ